MKISDIYKINRAAESGAITSDQYAKLHEQLANEKLDNKLNDDGKTEDINKWLSEQTKDFDDTDIEFLDAAGEQKAHYFDELKQISTAHDKQTQRNLEQLSDKQADRAEAISKHLDQQRMSLAKAIKEHTAAKNDYIKKREELKQLQTKYTGLRAQSDKQQIVINEKREQFAKLDAAGKAASDDIKNHYSKNDNFDIEADSQISAPDYALRKARGFAESQQLLSDTAAQQQDPDVRMRIEMEQLRRESAFRRDQNINIEALTGQSRAGVIEMHENNQSLAAITAAELDLKLEAKGIKVDFTQSEPDIRAIEHHELLDQKIQDGLAVIELKRITRDELIAARANEELVNKDVNQAAFDMDNKAVEVSEARNKVENKSAEVIERKLSLTDRLKQNQVLAQQKNTGTVMSKQQSTLHADARANQLRLAEQARLQQTQQASHGLSR